MKNQYFNIYEHDYIFWIGDFNYRLNNLQRNQIFAKLEIEDYESLMLNDQMVIEKNKLNILTEFNEGSVNFPPTFKYFIGGQTFTDGKRSPA